MRHNGTRAGDGELILALTAGATMQHAAEEAGVSQRTAYRRRKDADFRRALVEAQRRMLDANRGRLVGLADKAVETLERLMESDKPSVALAAAKVILELGQRLGESAEQEERINCWEDQINENQTSADDDELILALAAGATTPDAAEQVGPGEQAEEQTVNGRFADADFQRAVSRARGGLLGTAVGRLATLGGKATDLIERLMENDKPSVARRAAKAVLQLGTRLRESTELKRRMSRLEDQADENQTAAIVDEGVDLGAKRPK